MGCGRSRGGCWRQRPPWWRLRKARRSTLRLCLTILSGWRGDAAKKQRDAPCQDRTGDLQIMRLTLYQLSQRSGMGVAGLRFLTKSQSTTTPKRRQNTQHSEPQGAAANANTPIRSHSQLYPPNAPTDTQLGRDQACRASYLQTTISFFYPYSFFCRYPPYNEDG